jgi:hypothetical protein
MDGKFSTAFDELMRGTKISRRGWGATTYIMKSGAIGSFTNPAFVESITVNQFPAGTAWVPALADLLASDWYVYTA